MSFRDSYARLVFTMIAIGIWALVLTQVGIPSIATRAEAAESVGGAAVSQERFFATLPLRWEVSSFQQSIDATNATYCSTLVTVRNLTDSEVDVEVEWFSATNSPQGIRSRTILAQQMLQFATDDGINMLPFVPQNNAGLGNMNGYAKVHADDLRILATANLICRDGVDAGSNLLAIVGIPTSPVGGTLDFFRAELPGSGGLRPLAYPDFPR